MIDEKKRRQIKEYHLIVMLQRDVENFRFYEIQELYNTMRITNRDLLYQLDKHALPFTDLEQCVYSDIIYLLVDGIMNNGDYEEKCTTLYAKRFPRIVDHISNLQEKLKGGNSLQFSDVLAPIEKQLNKNKLELGEFDFLLFLFFGSKELIDAIDIPYEIIVGEMNWVRTRQGTEYELNDDRVVFEDGEKVFGSSAYYKYIERQRNRLCEYLGVTQNNLSKEILKRFDMDLRQEDRSFVVSEGMPGISTMATHYVMQLEHGCTRWYSSIVGSRTLKNRVGSIGFKPDLEEIINRYYKARVFTKYTSRLNQGYKEFRKSDLFGSKADNPLEDYISICFLYQIDIVYQMFKFTQRQYYNDFSWENITGRNRLLQNQQTILDLREEIARKEDALQRKEAELSIVIGNSAKNGEERLKIATEEIRSLNQIIDRKDGEIEKLNTQIQSLKEFIELSTQTEDEVGEPIDIVDLQNHKYLFVGFFEEALPELKMRFPGSCFMTSEGYSLTNIKVDAVVLLIKWMSHGMLYKIRAERKLQDIPIIYCNSKNINNIYSDMQQGLMRSNYKLITNN